MFHGSIVALVTPMTAEGAIDENCLRELVEMHIKAGTDAIVAVGTTGEGATLTEAEQQQVIKIVVAQAADRIPVIAGTGTNSTAKTLKLTQAAMECGVDACLIVTPYYNKPTQEGLYQHYKTIAEQVAVPIVLYNVPARTAVDMLPETVARLASIPNIIGLKEATNKIERIQDLLQMCGDSLDIYSGEDAPAVEYMLAGAKGVISVTANVAPRLMHEMCAAAIAGNRTEALALNDKLKLLHEKLFVESNPIPTKWAMHRIGLIPPGIRLPLTKLAPQFYEVVEQAMQKAGIITVH